MISKEIKFLLTHSSIYGLGTVVSQAVAFLLLPLYTRYLTPQDYGILELINITSSILGIIATIGIIRALSRFYYEQDNPEYQNRVVSTTYITYFLIASSFISLILPLTGYFADIILDSEKYSYYFKINFITLALGGLVDTGLMYLRIKKRPFIFISITISRLIMLISLNILFIVYLKLGVLGILYSSLITKIFFSIIITIPILCKTKIRFSFNLSKQLLKFSIPLIPASFANILVNQSDRYFIRFFLSISETGIYSLAQKLGSSIHLLLTMPFITAYMPRRFELMNKPDAKLIYNKVFKYSMSLMIFVGLAISILIPEILVLMTTPEFYAAGKYVPLIILSMIIFSCRYHFEFGILWSKKTKYYAYINIGTAIINLTLNMLLIPRFGLWGAVYTSLTVISIHSICLLIISNRFYQIDYEFYSIFKMFLVAFTLFYFSHFIETDSLMLDTTIKSLLVCIFPLGLILAKVFSQEELNKLKQILDQISLKYIFLKKPFHYVKIFIK